MLLTFSSPSVNNTSSDSDPICLPRIEIHFFTSVGNQPFEEHLLPAWLFWSVTGLIIIGGLAYGYFKGQKKQLKGV